jgi:uncharacterized protein YndB with AHSA1/START domain
VPEPGDTPGSSGLELTRVFKAPRERLWREWTEPERFADWFGGREAHIPVDSVSMDVRPGGRWRATMHHDGLERQWEGVYREVVEPARLVLTFSDQPGEEAHEVVTVVFTDLGDGRTEMRVEQPGPLPPELYERSLEGWSAFFDRLAERLHDA